MKNLLLVLALVSTVVFGALYFFERQESGKKDAQIAELNGQAAKQTAEVAALKAAGTEARREAGALRAQLEEAAREAAASPARTAAGTNATGVAGGKPKAKDAGKGFAALFNDPEMRDMMKNQQKLVLGPMVDKMFGEFFKQLQMNDEQKTYLKDLLLKKMLVGAESGLEMMGSDIDPARRKELADKIRKDMAGYDAQIKDYLGEPYYSQFQQYEKTQGERMQFDQFKEQLGSGANALSAQQQEQLLQAMIQQRENFKWTIDFADQSRMPENPGEMFTPEKMATFSAEKERFDRELLARAQPLLTPEQFTAYEKFLTAQRQMQTAGMKIAAQMFAPKQ